MINQTEIPQTIKCNYYSQEFQCDALQHNCVHLEIPHPDRFPYSFQYFCWMGILIADIRDMRSDILYVYNVKEEAWELPPENDRRALQGQVGQDGFVVPVGEVEVAKKLLHEQYLKWERKNKPPIEDVHD